MHEKSKALLYLLITGFNLTVLGTTEKINAFCYWREKLDFTPWPQPKVVKLQASPKGIPMHCNNISLISVVSVACFHHKLTI